MRTHAVLIGSALGFALIATPIGAQETGPNTTPGPASSEADQENVNVRPPDNVFIVSPPLGRSVIGAPIVDVAVSRTIRTDDLDLRTDAGVRELRSRIRTNAGALCRWLNAMYPVDHERGGWLWLQASPCYRNAVKNAMAQADGAIRDARAYGGR